MNNFYKRFIDAHMNRISRLIFSFIMLAGNLICIGFSIITKVEWYKAAFFGVFTIIFFVIYAISYALIELDLTDFLEDVAKDKKRDREQIKKEVMDELNGKPDA